MEVRRVQQVGSSTLTVSLPREWARSAGLKRGDMVSFEADSEGGLRIVPGLASRPKETPAWTVNADECNEKGLLTRVVTGNYIVGHDTINIVSKEGLCPAHLEEIRDATIRLTGLGIVEQTMDHITLQSFLDLTKFSVYGLLRRLHVITTSMHAAVSKALVERNPEFAQEALSAGDESDKIYWLIVRQLLLAAGDKEVRGRVEMSSPLHVLGNRVIAKSLEKMGDHLENAAREIINLLKQRPELKPEVVRKIDQFSKSVLETIDDAIESVFSHNLKLANRVIEEVKRIRQEERVLAMSTASAVEQLPAALSLWCIIRSYGEVARNASTIAEIAINRVLEEPSALCTPEMGSAEAMVARAKE